MKRYYNPLPIAPQWLHVVLRRFFLFLVEVNSILHYQAQEY